MNNPPLVYIIILTWNGRDDSLECLKSLQKLEYPNARILLVDNASSDGTTEVVRKTYSDVEIIVNPTNLRFSGGNNTGIKYALEKGAEYVLLLNNDTVVDHGFLTHLVRQAQENATVGMAGPKIYYYSHPRCIWFAGGKIDWWKGWISHVGIREEDRGQYDSMRKVDYLTACCLLVKCEVIEHHGMLDERFFMYGEDADWCLRTQRAGYTLLYVPSSVIWHKVSVSAGGHLSWFKNWNKLKSQLRLMVRYAKPYHWFTIPLVLTGNILIAFFKALSYRSIRKNK